jgi:uncharacterized protein (TIGR02246 family)
MHRNRVHLLVTALSLILFNSASFAAAPKADPARAPIEKLGAAFADAFNRGDTAAIAAMYSDDAIAFPPDSDLVQGRSAIEALWKTTRDSGMKDLAFTVLDVQSSGDLAVEVGKADFKIQAANQAESSSQTVKYVVVWKRQRDGAWKLFRDIWNGMPSAPK